MTRSLRRALPCFLSLIGSPTQARAERTLKVLGHATLYRIPPNGKCRTRGACMLSAAWLRILRRICLPCFVAKTDNLWRGETLASATESALGRARRQSLIGTAHDLDDVDFLHDVPTVASTWPRQQRVPSVGLANRNFSGPRRASLVYGEGRFSIGLALSRVRSKMLDHRSNST
jgi:hypothetical protein